MPKIVDHDQRRAELAKHVIRVMVREGLAGTTVRGVAREAGFTSGILSHYFTGKEDMINFALNAVSDKIYEVIDRKLMRAAGAREKLKVVIETHVPISQGSEGSVVSIIFWASAIHEPVLRAQFERVYDKWRLYVTAILNDAVKQGEISASSDINVLTDLVIAACDGFVVSWTVQPDRMTTTARRKAVDQILQIVGFSQVGEHSRTVLASA